jgi:predicted nucleic-acid-binding Zn-ribbon protein
MPKEYSMLKNAPEKFDRCPSCHNEPFQSFMRGQVQKEKKWLFIKEREYCAVICKNCKEIVGYEDPHEMMLLGLITQ